MNRKITVKNDYGESISIKTEGETVLIKHKDFDNKYHSLFFVMKTMMLEKHEILLIWLVVGFLLQGISNEDILEGLKDARKEIELMA